MDKLGLDLNDAEEARRLSIRQCIKTLAHACHCRDANCDLPSCPKMSRVVSHAKVCKRRTNGGCPICKQLIALCCYHAKNCQEAKCAVPFCANIKKKLKDHKERLAQNQLVIRRIQTNGTNTVVNPPTLAVAQPQPVSTKSVAQVQPDSAQTQPQGKPQKRALQETGVEKASASQESKKSRLSSGSGDVDNKISQKDVSMWTSTKGKSETLSFVWDVQDIKDILMEEIESREYTGGQQTKELLWELKINPRHGSPTPQLRIGLQLNNQCLPPGFSQVKGAYQVKILDSNWTILSTTKSATSINFALQHTHWNIVFPTSDLDRHLIDDNFLRINVEIVIETGLEHRQIDPKTGVEVGDSGSN